MKVHFYQYQPPRDFAKIELATLRVVNNYMKPKELKKALLIVEANQQHFVRAWNEYFN
jgi:hypothetical protein